MFPDPDPGSSPGKRLVKKLHNSLLYLLCFIEKGIDWKTERRREFEENYTGKKIFATKNK